MTQLPSQAVADRSEKEAITSLMMQLGGLPLAIKQMGSFLRESGCSVVTLLDLLKDTTQFQEILANETAFASKEYNHTLASVWAVSLSKLDSLSLGLLRTLSFLDPDGISGSIVTALRDVVCGRNYEAACPFATSITKYVDLPHPDFCVERSQILSKHPHSTKVWSDRTRSQNSMYHNPPTGSSHNPTLYA